MDKTTDGKQIAIFFVKACIDSGIPIIESYLFGSWVKGKANAYSDVDIALISNSFGKNIIENSRQTALINFEYPDVEVHHFSPDEFITNNPFINEIKRTGIKIY